MCTEGRGFKYEKSITARIGKILKKKGLDSIRKEADIDRKKKRKLRRGTVMIAKDIKRKKKEEKNSTGKRGD